MRNKRIAEIRKRMGRKIDSLLSLIKHKKRVYEETGARLNSQSSEKLRSLLVELISMEVALRKSSEEPMHPEKIEERFDKELSQIEKRISKVVEKL